MAIWSRSRLGSPFMDGAGAQIEPNTRDVVFRGIEFGQNE